MPRWARPNNRSTRQLTSSDGTVARIPTSGRPLLAFAIAAAVVALLAAILWPASGDPGASGLALPADSAPDSARVATPGGSNRSPVVANHLAPRAPKVRPASVHGTIRWDYGGTVEGAEVALLDAAGEVVAEVKTDGTGAYALLDEALAGAELQVTEPFGSSHQRDLSPLRAGEDRAFDVVIGDAREVVGWVLDGVGDPLPGVLVTASWEAAKSRWSAVTDGGGGFTFVDVPATPLRVTADGGELGIASARVARSDATRREVTLVLEPTGTILVRADAEVAKLGQVTVRCFSAAAHGEDGLWNDDLRPPEGGINGSESNDLGEAVPDGMSSDEVPAQVHDEPSMPEVEAMIGNALRGWDATDPEGSLVRLALDLARADPRMEAEMRRDMASKFPELGSASLEDVAQAAANKVLDEEPRVLDMMGLAALKLQEGAGPVEAFMLAEQELREPVIEPAALEAPAEGVAVAVEPAMPQPATPEDLPSGAEAGTEDNVAEAGVILDEAALPLELTENPGESGTDYLEPDNFDGDLQQRIEELRAVSHIDTIGMGDEPRSIVATGRFFDPIPVRGAFEYQVSIKTADGYELVCGNVFVSPGEEVEITCGGSGPALLTGRVVDTRGAPLEGARVEVYSDTLYETRSDKDGRYELSPRVTGAQLLTVTAGAPDGTVWAQRRQQNARVGARTEVPVLVARRPDEMPDHNLTEPFGGVGASVELGSEGIILSALFDDGPLAMAGVGAGDVIVRIGEEVGASLSVDDALLMLRGDVGTDVDLTLRSAAGELYDLLVTRGLVTPVPAPEYP